MNKRNQNIHITIPSQDHLAGTEECHQTPSHQPCTSSLTWAGWSGDSSCLKSILCVMTNYKSIILFPASLISNSPSCLRNLLSCCTRREEQIFIRWVNDPFNAYKYGDDNWLCWIIFHSHHQRTFCDLERENVPRQAAVLAVCCRGP